MAELSGVNINPLEGGLGRKGSNTDGVVALAILMAVLPSNDLVYGQSKKLIQLKDAENLGINEAYDANNNVLVHHHLSEIFRISPDAVVYLIPMNNAAATPAEIAEAINPVLRENSEVKGLGLVGFNTLMDGNFTGFVSNVQKEIVDKLRADNRFIDYVLIEGKGDGVITYQDLPDLRTLSSKNVATVIGQDPAIAALADAYNYYAAVGSALGSLSVRKVNENIGSVNIVNKPRNFRGTQDYTLTDSTINRYLSASISTGAGINMLSKADLNALNEKGYIFIASYEGYAGFFFSNSPTATAIDSDYAYVENNRVFNKAARLIRLTLIPQLKSVVPKDPETGYIKSTIIGYWESILDNALSSMVKAAEISGFQIYIDSQQIVDSETPLKVKVKIVMDGIVYEFDVDLGLTNSIN